MNSKDKQNPNPMGIKGSFVIAANCKDGIIIVSESRGNIYDKGKPNQQPIAFYDTVQKIFPIGNAAIAATGQGLIETRFFSTIIKEFENGLNQQPKIAELLKEFLKFCKRTCSPGEYSLLENQVLFAAGYENGTPILCYYDKRQANNPFYSGTADFIESEETIFKKKWTAESNCEDVADLADDAIKDHAKDGNRWHTIGGPTDVLKLSSTGVSWISKGTPDQTFSNLNDLRDAYTDGTFNPSLIPPATKQDLDTLIAGIR